MREIRQSGSEGGATTVVPTPITADSVSNQSSQLDFAPTELIPFGCVAAIKIWLLRSRSPTVC
jgi:hypothetical protein